jgi:hypothetical protein
MKGRRVGAKLHKLLETPVLNGQSLQLSEEFLARFYGGLGTKAC